MKKSEEIREQLAIKFPMISDEQLNIMVGIFVLCATYNHTQGGEITFGKSLEAILNGIRVGFCEEEVYNYCVESVSELQDESVIITIN